MILENKLNIDHQVELAKAAQVHIPPLLNAYDLGFNQKNTDDRL